MGRVHDGQFGLPGGGAHRCPPRWAGWPTRATSRSTGALPPAGSATPPAGWCGLTGQSPSRSSTPGRTWARCRDCARTLAGRARWSVERLDAAVDLRARAWASAKRCSGGQQGRAERGLPHRRLPTPPAARCASWTRSCSGGCWQCPVPAGWCTSPPATELAAATPIPPMPGARCGSSGPARAQNDEVRMLGRRGGPRGGRAPDAAVVGVVGPTVFPGRGRAARTLGARRRAHLIALDGVGRAVRRPASRWACAVPLR